MSRSCPDIGAEGRGLVVVAGDRTLAADCTSASLDTGEVVWEAGRRHGQGAALLASCTHLVVGQEEGRVRGGDCVNGTLLPHRCQYGRNLGTMDTHTVTDE